MSSPLTTHVLDTARGVPAAGIAVSLARQSGDRFEPLAAGVTDADGRIRDLLTPAQFTPGVYRISFALDAYFAAQGGVGFYPHADVVFRVEHPDQHHHVPLLLSPYGYSTYRGS